MSFCVAVPEVQHNAVPVTRPTCPYCGIHLRHVQQSVGSPKVIGNIAAYTASSADYLHAEISIGDCIVGMVQLYAVVTELGEVCFKWFILLRSASREQGKDVLSADIGSSGVQTHF